MSSLDKFRLNGRRALVTGAGRGIGRAIALGLASAGAQVTLCARSERDLVEAASAIEQAGGEAEVMVADVTDLDGFDTAIRNRPPFDILVNNAGTNRPKPLREVTAEDFDAVIGLNLRAAFFVVKSVAVQMIQAGVPGSIINISSQMGHVGAANRSLYCASKWGLEGLTKALSVELGPQKIRINTLCPTFIETPMTRPFLQDESFRQSVLEKIKLGRIGVEDDVVGAAIFLASDYASLMTGSALIVDGGWTAD